MSLRPIQPFPTPQQPDDDGGDKHPVKCRTNTVRVCDGSRPRCQTCVSRNKECVYRGDEGQSREAIMKSRIDVLEQRIRELEAGQSSCPQPGEPEEPEESEEPEEPENPSAAGPIIQRVHSSIELTFPNTPIMERAIDGFFTSSGKLFHVFSEAQVLRITNSVYSELDNESEDQKADIGCLMAVAAVGSQYTSTTIDNDIQEACYDIARLYLDAVIAQRPLDAIKLMHRQVDEMTDSMWLDYRRTWRTLIFLTT
ncbi:hypothetical protein E0Z10_g7239 [Xylaria hypoxylon]|uniref:Zn(2)-C6 fungal-type domain-containing protein n=1 Tax=Xylaria hypoxylon TaxID=37992 RepID=A0A4Z0YR60_9PEZI|nr:hypothetical protein E0Z10_g7239 [Xylaria hypoxylon]